jgi:saccharopine dehydrogenase-like NADP-dependent oxidoreductase
MSVGSADLTKYDWLPTLPVSYSLQTILEEFSLKPAVYRGGKIQFLEPMSGGEPQVFPKPVGVRRPLYTLHSELATIPKSFAKKGVTEVSFKIAFDDDFVNKVRFLRDIGLANREAIDVGGTRVKPIEVVNKIAMSQPAPKYSGSLKQYEVVRSVVKGTRGKKKVTCILDCHTKGMPEWGMGTDTNTGCPPSIVAGLLLSGEISKRGALAPEHAVPDKSFFKALEKRNMVVREREVSGWTFGA